MTRLARAADGTPLLGDGEGFVPLDSVRPEFGSVTDALPRAAANDLAVGDAGGRVPDAGYRFGGPLQSVGKVWGIGLNYVEHAGDLGEDHPEEPASFMKPASAVTGPGGPIRLPPREHTERVTAEAELGVVIGRTCRDVAVEDAMGVVAGYVPILDMTAEDVLGRNPRFLTRAKSYDTFLVYGPWIRTTDATDLRNTEIRTVVNGRTEARNAVGNMRFGPAELVSFHSEVMTLHPGDLISTGTPGAHPIEAGDDVRAEVEGIGALEAPVE
jgi:2-keto-4-pentenoate hydratase/2-oxohepta-3-ene-1,7-dioic acid hydratase in catechol pathway